MHSTSLSFSETWDPTQHTPLHFPALGNPDARPEQAPNQGVRELLYQYEALQATPTGPLNVFWNDEEETGRIRTDDNDDDVHVGDGLMNQRVNRFRTSLLLVGMIGVLSAVALVCGTLIIVFGSTTSNEWEPSESIGPSSSYVFFTQSPIATSYPSASTISTSDGNESSNTNIFAQPPSTQWTLTLVPSQMPTMTPTMLPIEIEEIYSNMSLPSDNTTTNVTLMANTTTTSNTTDSFLSITYNETTSPAPTNTTEMDLLLPNITLWPTYPNQTDDPYIIVMANETDLVSSLTLEPILKEAILPLP